VFVLLLRPKGTRSDEFTGGKRMGFCAMCCSPLPNATEGPTSASLNSPKHGRGLRREGGNTAVISARGRGRLSARQWVWQGGPHAATRNRLSETRRANASWRSCSDVLLPPLSRPAS